MRPTYDQIAPHLAAGLTYDGIATALGATRGAIAGAIWRHRNPGLNRKGVTHSEANSQERDARRKRDRLRAVARGHLPRRCYTGDWDSFLTETWAERKLRRQGEARP